MSAYSSAIVFASVTAISSTINLASGSGLFSVPFFSDEPYQQGLSETGANAAKKVASDSDNVFFDFSGADGSSNIAAADSKMLQAAQHLSIALSTGNVFAGQSFRVPDLSQPGNKLVINVRKIESSVADERNVAKKFRTGSYRVCANAILNEDSDSRYSKKISTCGDSISAITLDLSPTRENRANTQPYNRSSPQ